MNEIGGYFELELNNTGEYHADALDLNTGRNALEYILRARGYKKVYLPYYSCSALLEPIKKLNLLWEFYLINKNLEPKLGKKPGNKEAVLYINYFGIKQQVVRRLKARFDNLIVDNSQAFYAESIEGIDTFYSARKFFGVPDGAYLYTNKQLDIDLPYDQSHQRMVHLLKRRDRNARSAYKTFLANEKELCNQPIKKMSKLTRALLRNIDYEKIKSVRERNFLFYHNRFRGINRLLIDIKTLNSPMVYPLLLHKKGIREWLIKNKIYIATYWNEIVSNVNEHWFEKELIDYLLPLPVDQRYGPDELTIVIEKIGDC
jgi:hypothetical protein